MSDFEFDFDKVMPIELKKFVFKLLEISNKHHTLSMKYRELPDKKGIEISDGAFIHDRVICEVIEGYYGIYPALSLESLGLIRMVRILRETTHQNAGPFHTPSDLYQEDIYIFITEKAFEWEKYTKKKPVHKWVIRTIDTFKDFMVIVAFVLTLVLTAIQIYNLLHPLKP
jgi:hypothetical protein